MTAIATEAVGVTRGHPSSLWWSRFTNLATCDSRSLSPSSWVFPILPGQFRDVGQRMKGLIVLWGLIFEWGEYLLSESLPFK